MAKKKEFSAKGWKANKELQAIADKDGPTEAAKYVEKSPNFSEKDYIDIMAGLYPHLDIGGYYRGNKIREALQDSKFNKSTTNDKAVDFTYDVMNLKKDWNDKNPKNKVDLTDHQNNLRLMFHDYDLSSKMLHKLVSEPKYMLEDPYSKKMEPPTQVLKNDKIKPEHLYKFLTHHPEHVNELIGHDKSDARLESMIFDKPEHLKNVTNESLNHYLGKNLTEETLPDGRIRSKLNIPPKRAKQIVENGHDKMYNDGLYKVLGAMDPVDKKDFIDRKLGIAGGKPGGLGSWRTDDEAVNQELDGKWSDWENGPEYDAKFAKRIAASPHLNDEQADHIKRQGDFGSRYELYHNKSVDPKHGAEMFKLWHDNDEAKGYDSQSLTNAYEKNKNDIYTLDDIDPDLINEDDLYESADQNAEYSYSFQDYINDNSKKLSQEIDLEDDDHEKIDEKLREDYDWEEENPKHDSDLHKAHQKILDNMEGDSINVQEASRLTGKTSKELGEGTGLFAPGDEEINRDDIERYMEEYNPQKIDFSNHIDHSISEHPDYQDRFEEIADSYKEDKLRDEPYEYYESFSDGHRESPGYQAAYSEAMTQAKEEAAKEHYDELYPTSHQDDRFVPEHLHQHIPNFEEIKKNRKKAIGEPTPLLDKHIPKRSYEHPYGEDQNSYELLKDYADANGGSIDIGRMHKLMPAQGDVWKKIFSNKGKLSSQEIQGKIESLPKTPYAISYGKWDSNKTQNLNNQDQIVFRLDHTDQSLKPLQEDSSVYNTFKKVQEVSKRSGHPTKENSIAWARVDATDPDHWMIDEVQSDFGKTVTQYLKENGDEEKSKHVQKISDYHKDWREALINSVIKEAKKAGASKVSTHSPESKSAHTGSENIHSVYKDSYQKVPRKMGFKPSPGQTLPITDQVKENVFNKNKSEMASAESHMLYHTDAWNEHKSWANAYNELSESKSIPPEGKSRFLANANYHTDMAEKHGNRAKEYGQEHGKVSIFPIVPSGKEFLEQAKEHLHAETKFEHPADKNLSNPVQDYTRKDYHQGHTLNLKPNLIKNMLDIVEDLVKFEIIYKNAEDASIKKRAQVNIDLIKNILGYEADLSKWEKRREVFNDLNKTEQTQIPKHNEKIRQVADQYAQSKGLALNHNIPQTKVDPEHAKKIANAYHNAQHNPSNPGVQKAYGALLNETNDQFKHILGTGLKITKMKPGQGNPYKSSKDLFRDIKNNNHMWYFPTEQGYGSGKNVSNHPLLQPTEHIHEGKPMLANDVFRIVHDYFGHAKEGIGFGPNGEEHAWKHHMQMYSPDAQKALTSETRGQNSWVNFGPHGEQNRKDPTNTIYADQKATILPDWAMKQGPESVYSKLNKSERPYPSHLPKFKRGDRVKLSHGVINKETGKYVIHDKVHIVHGVAKQGQHAHWVVPEGESSNKGFYHKTDRMHHADEVKKSENDLMKAITPEEMKQQGYRLKHLVTAKGHLAGIKLYHGKNAIGHLHYSTHPNSDGFHRVLNGDIEQKHRGKGLYQQMIMTAHNKVKEQGSKGVVSEGYQRSNSATRAWEKIATDKKDVGYPTSVGIKQSDGSYKNELRHTPRIDYYVKKYENLQINISLPDEELDLIKAEDYKPTSVGEIHPTKPLVGAMHPETGLAWHHNKEIADKNDSIINDPEMRQRLLSKMPTATHKAGMEAIMNLVAKSPNRHFIPSRDQGREKMRARHIKSLILNPESAKISLDNNVMTITMDRHGPYGGVSNWSYNLKPKKVVKSEQSGFRKNEQGRDFELNERIRLSGNLRRYRRNSRSFKKAQYRTSAYDSRNGNSGDLVKGDFSNKLKTGLAGMAIATSSVTPSVISDQKTGIEKAPIAQMTQQHSDRNAPKINREKERILGAISDVESSGGKNTKHARLPANSIHRGERAYGKFGITPVIIRETIKANPKTFAEHSKAMNMRGSDIHNYMDAHPELEGKIASTHYDRLAKVFGHDPEKIARAWIGGITGTKNAIKKGENISKHWHVIKVKSAYEARKKKVNK